MPKQIKSRKYRGAMARKTTESQANRHEQMVPAGWPRALVTSWKTTNLAQVEVRKGPKGAMRCIDAVVLDEVAEDDDLHVVATDVCQRLWDRAYEYHLDVGGTVDAHLVLLDEGGEEIARVTTGGRMRGGETEDPEESEGGQTLRTALWAVEKVTKLHVATIEKFNAFVDAMTPFMAQAGQVESARIQAEADIVKVNMVDDIVDKATERFAPLLYRYAEAKHNETVSGRTRKPTGEPVVDAWREAIDVCDPPTMAKLRDALPAKAFAELAAALELGDTMTRDDVVAFWRKFRAMPGVMDGWPALVAALPERARKALPTLADAVRDA